MSRTTRAMARLTLFVLVVIIFSVGFFGTAPRATQAQTTPRTAFVHLFEWKWTDIAKECENWLGPKGFAAVQVSPPQEHIQGSQWWTRYQPVSYQIQSRSGTRAEFANMVSRCKAVGVDIYVDAVINHMTGVGSGTGVAGSSYTSYNYPGNYQTQDFHHCGRNGNDDISNYQDRWEVQNCELVNLADLKTESDYVRGKLAAYLNDLRSLGVAGFRIDAAKHMPAADIANIMSRASNPYIYQEVIDQGGEPITSGEYTGNGDVTEFKYSTNIGRMFKTDKLANMSNFGTAWGFIASDSAVVFTDNHDNQRGHGGAGNVVTFKDGKLYELANVFALAWPYGYPQVMSSYNFSNGDQGPPSSNVYNGNTADCGGSNWVCEHRWRGIANMVGFRNYTSTAFSTSNWWSNGNNQISFSRGSLGFVAINREGSSLSRTFATGLPAGTYCDVIHGDFNNGSCSGPTISVNSSGQATITVAAMDSVAIHGGAKINGTNPTPVPTTPPSGSIAVTFNENATTVWGQNVYVIGNVSALGSWNTANAVLLSSASYPVWSKTINLPASTAIEYKYIKKDGSGNVTWESGSNRTFTTPSSGTVTRNDTWK
ncbi:MAG TPA: ATPase [Herpetosiphon sp.]|uniref:Alpha-amylase n=1 Tax=Herpetosiphon aurantiacus (strain ATCC 23779 / DSM 785 / 114-95) TaxID=316274 RepID=A9AVU7_HERA2|nr:carbohydrate-binding module family 20 domain-containing protein [Herpetosiphon sp.]ABX06697.1 Alpha-amylase [Herpetosiphon aurantiacus DSM 785]HBW52225.1 ATPase [Herpetosiphon sp.]